MTHIVRAATAALGAAGRRLDRYNNATFRDAAMATCALIAAADGSVAAAEKSKVAKLIAGNELLQVFDGAALRDSFLAYCDKAGDEFTRLDVLNVVRRLKADPAGADTCLRVALLIAAADGDTSGAEAAVVRELCGVLGLPAADYLPA